MAAAKGHIVQMRSELDDMGVFKAVWYYKRIWMVCMLAAFSASLEGYRVYTRPGRGDRQEADDAEVNLNGSIVSNSGFYHKLFGIQAKKSPSKYVSAWGGIQSAGQFLGQVFLQFATDALGRKWAMYILWLMLVIVSA